jgi:N-hydroxyarylamine O-acetyltransferase
MAAARIDLDAYFARIGYGGPRQPTLAVLRALQVLHPHAIPYENLSPLMGEPVSLDLQAIQAKLVGDGRGGYCFEQNHLFMAVLEALGFQVTPLAARVLWNLPDDAPPRPRTHMLLLVALPEGRHIADVGFGGVMLTGPLRLEPGAVQDTPHDRYRLLPLAPDAYELQAQLGGAWRPLHRFDLTPQVPADYEMMNWYCATHPASRFVFSLMAARTGPQGRVTLANTRLTVRRTGEPPVERMLESMEQLKAVLTGDFGLALPPGVDRIWDKVRV